MTHRVLLYDLFMRFRNDENAATAIEYSVIAAGIGLVVFGAVHLVGSRLTAIFASVAVDFP